MIVNDERLTVRQAARELGVDGADLYRMVLDGEVLAQPDVASAEVYITREEVERLRATLVR